MHLKSRLVGSALIAWCCTVSGASAQAPVQQPTTASSLADVSALVPVGGIVEITDNTGGTTRGSLVAATDHAIQVDLRGAMRSVAAADIRRIQWQRPDSPLTGVLVGAAIGAAPGIYWLIADPNECTGMCPEDYASIALGAVIGGIIDHLIHKKVTVYARPSLLRSRKGAQIVMEF